MTFLGFGFSPFGSSPFGFGDVGATNSTTAKLFIKADGTQGNTAQISPVTFDYVLDSNGIKQGADSTPVMVQMALFTIKNSSSVIGFGLESPNGTFTPDMDRKTDAAVRAALKHMTTKKLISIQKITLVRQNVRAASIHVEWVDLVTGKKDTTQVTF